MLALAAAQEILTAIGTAEAEAASQQQRLQQLHSQEASLQQDLANLACQIEAQRRDSETLQQEVAAVRSRLTLAEQEVAEKLAAVEQACEREAEVKQHLQDVQAELSEAQDCLAKVSNSCESGKKGVSAVVSADQQPLNMRRCEWVVIAAVVMGQRPGQTDGDLVDCLQAKADTQEHQGQQAALKQELEQLRQLLQEQRALAESAAAEAAQVAAAETDSVQNLKQVCLEAAGQQYGASCILITCPLHMAIATLT